MKIRFHKWFSPNCVELLNKSTRSYYVACGRLKVQKCLRNKAGNISRDHLIFLNVPLYDRMTARRNSYFYKSFNIWHHRTSVFYNFVLNIIVLLYNGKKLDGLGYSVFLQLCKNIVWNFNSLQANLFQKLATSAEHVVYQNCPESQNKTKTTICVHIFCRYSEHTIFMNNLSS